MGLVEGKKWRYFDDMEATCSHRDNITPTVLLDSSKDNDHSDHSEGESINDTVCGSFSVMETLDRQSCIFFNSPTISLIRMCMLL